MWAWSRSIRMYTQTNYLTSKSATCFGKSTRKPLTEYATEIDAKNAAIFILAKYANDLVPYRCKHCGFWHLSPKTRCTPSKKCPICTCSNGFSKEAYRSADEAKTRASIIYKERRVSLTVYPCEYGHGWHLTKQL